MSTESAGSERQTNVERVVMSIPARAEYVGVVRLAAAAIAGRMAFGYDEVEDLKVAVSEACSEAILSAGSLVEIQFEVFPDRLEILVAGGADRGEERAQESDMGLLLMRVLMDEVRTERQGVRRLIRLIKRLSA
ncbi:MAG: ATP-binding protein [bacterium]